MAKWTLLLILILLLPVASAVNYPQINKAFVTDNANIIDPVYKDKITQLAQNIEKETTVEIAVVTVKSLEGESKEMYAEKLFRQPPGIGKKDKDNGLLILVAKQEGEYRFEVGYGLEGTITDSMKVNIGDRIIVPNFRNGEYGKGIYESMVVVEGLVKGNEEVISQYSMPSNPPPPPYNPQQMNDQGMQTNWGGIVFFVAIIFIIIILNAMNRSKYDDEEWRRKHRYRERPVEFPFGGGWNWGSGGGGGWHSGGGFGGGFGGGGSGGGFGGFGGGRSGGGGFGGKW
ncbi:MAG: TPM domain-containing protein [Candidatus Methanoperedens sp.]|nr:TPM domain-containing protein [Candidatus Methanoperedens sp.]